MVCILCDSKTKITNSRFMRRGGYTWRRHTCPRCNALYTTRELIDTGLSYRVQYSGGSLEPLIREKILLSVVESLKHRKSYLTEAVALTDTILGLIHAEKQLIVPISRLHDLAGEVIKRFDRTAYIRYLSMATTESGTV